MNKPEMILFSDSARGSYIPQHFAESIRRDCVNLTDEDYAVLMNPDHECYWDTWADVCDNAVVTDDHGIKYRLWQDGDLWLIPEGMEWSEEEGEFAWPDTVTA